MAKKIILCADGTWNTPHGPSALPNDTNVRKLYSLVAPQADQLKYYDSGVGTNGTHFEHFFGGAMGEGLFEKVQDGYEFLAFVWDPGDEIFLFGFSRGAYTARSLGGMIAYFGVPNQNIDNMTVRRIFDAYRIMDHDQKLAAKKELAAEYALTEVNVKMIGVWDTVGALGIPLRAFGAWNQKEFQFHDTGLSRAVRFAFHALAIDEHREPFLPTLWETAPDPGQTVQQVWFAGAHSDVGGGYPEHGLSDLALDWMLASAKTAGLEIDTNVVGKLPTAPDYKQKVHDSKSVIYTFSGADRTVGGTKFNTEYFHKSIVERWRDGGYRPKPLQPHAARLDALAKGPLNDEIYPVA